MELLVPFSAFICLAAIATLAFLNKANAEQEENEQNFEEVDESGQATSPKPVSEDSEKTVEQRPNQKKTGSEGDDVPKRAQ